MELFVESFSHLNLKYNKIYALGDFYINFLLKTFYITNYILSGKGTTACQAPVATLINKH